MATPYYKILMTVLEQNGVYGTTIDVTEDLEITDYVAKNGISTMKVESDDGDYTVGIFVIGDVTLRTINQDGKFLDATDWRTLFPYSRDLSKIEIIYVDKNGIENTRFKGLVTEEGTREDLFKNTVKLKVLNQQGILRKSTIVPGRVRTGMTFKEAMIAILNVPEITNILNFNEDDINPDLNLTLDTDLFFDGKSAYNGLTALLQASNSVLVVDSDDNIIVKSREVNNNSPYEFFGGEDRFGRTNIISIKNYNTGLHRAYNTVKVGNYTDIDDDYVDRYGGRQKEFDFEFITDRRKSLQIARQITGEFKTPKIEMEIIIRTEDVKDIEMFDLCTIKLDRRIASREGADVPLYAHAEYGIDKYPLEIGNLRIPDTMGFKVTAIRENPKDFTTQLRLREIGKTEGDSFITLPSILITEDSADLTTELDEDIALE